MPPAGAGTATGSGQKDTLRNWFSFNHQLTPSQQKRIDAIGLKGQELANEILNVVNPGDDQVRAIQQIREGCMTAVSAIAFNGG
jgi:hypothetical protein